MPAMRFHVRWPDGRTSDCYSPSLIIKDFFSVGQAYALPDFMTRVRDAYRIANERVREKYGFTCSQAGAQLDEIETIAARFATNGTAEVAVVQFSEAG
jgi:uncharacterized repeat protein (TIGR04042 family)